MNPLIQTSNSNTKNPLKTGTKINVATSVKSELWIRFPFNLWHCLYCLCILFVHHEKWKVFHSVKYFHFSLHPKSMSKLISLTNLVLWLTHQMKAHFFLSWSPSSVLSCWVPGPVRGVNHFNNRCTRFLIFQRDFWLKRTRFLISYKDFQIFLRSDLPLGPVGLSTTSQTGFIFIFNSY